MKQTLFSFIVGLSLILTGVIALPTAGAQDVQTNPGLDYETAPGTGTDGETTDPGVGGTTTNTQDDGSNLWWLLPLLAIPVLFFVFRRGEDEDRDRSYSTGGYAIGAKGGRSRRDSRDRDERTEEEEVL